MSMSITLGQMQNFCVMYLEAANLIMLQFSEYFVVKGNTVILYYW